MEIIYTGNTYHKTKRDNVFFKFCINIHVNINSLDIFYAHGLSKRTVYIQICVKYELKKRQLFLLIICLWDNTILDYPVSVILSMKTEKYSLTL